MGKRRNAEKKSYAGAEGGATSSKSYGGVGSKNDKFSVFEFADDDLRVENESRKTLAKFGTKSPSKKPVHHRQPVDKYVFLELLAHGTMTQQKDSGNDMPDVDVTDSDFQDRTFGTDVRMSFGSLNYESQPFSLTRHQGLECTCGAKSYAPRSRKPGRYTAGKKHNEILYVDSDEDGKMKLRSLSSACSLENEGSLKEQSSEYGANSNDCEAVVVVAPHYVKYGKIYYTRCLLTFSQRCIRLEGSPLCDRKRTYCLEWSTLGILNIEYQQCESVKADVVSLHLKSKDTNVDEAGNWNSGSVELEFVVLDDPLWSEKQEEIKSLDLKYKAAWKTNISECSFNESFEDMVYPHGDPDAVFISRRDIELLQPRTFINDTIIDFYIKYLLNKTKPEEQHRFHSFNTFFFRKLVAMDQDLSGAWEGRCAFQRVHKWTRNVNIFEKDYIFIPVNFSLHWSLVIICHPGEVANLRDEVMDESSKLPCILHMDSIRGSHQGFENLIRRYLWEEWKERRNKQEEDIEMKFLSLDFVSLQLPQQENLFDCGLFLLHYAELFLEQASNFGTTKYFDFLNKDWFLPAEVSLKKRDHIRKLIHRIVEDNALKDPPAAHNNECLQSFGINEGDNSTKFVQKDSVKESCCGINSNDDFYIKGRQSFIPMLEQKNIDKSVTDECFQPYKLLVPINQFNNLSLPMEEAFEKQTTFPEGDISSRYETDKQMPPCCQHSSFRTVETKDSLETSKTCSDKFPIIIDVQNEEDCVPEVAFPTERQKEMCANSSMSSEDLAECVVEDSEDESGAESIRRTRRSSFLISSVDLNKGANYANTLSKLEGKQKAANMELTRL